MGSIAALIASGAMLLTPAQPAQAYGGGSCEMLESVMYLAAANNDGWYVFELWERGMYMNCW